MIKLISLLKEVSVNSKGELEDFDFENDDLLSKEEWDKYKKEYDSTGLNWLLRQFLVLDGEEEKTEEYWDFDVYDIMSEFRIQNETAASLIYDICKVKYV